VSSGANQQDARRSALRFVVIIGVVSLFSDMTYEAARGTNGSFLAALGATSIAVGLISGFGELLGYLVRLISGPLASRSGRYWLWTGIGYLVNLLAVPALALANHWELAAALIIAERIGKGLRNPPRDAMLSNAGSVIGQGWAFALREALDQAGALVGPLLVALILFLRGSFHLAYACLLIPAVLSLLSLAVARRLFPRPQAMERSARRPTPATNFPAAFWIYVVAMGLVAFGYADFNLISFHLEKVGDPSGVIPLLYAAAMATAGASALLIGRWFDRAGLRAIVVAAVLSTLFAPLVFLGNLGAAAVGVALWGIGMGIQDSLMSAPLATMIHAEARARAFGVFNALYGVAWFTGSGLLGFLYGRSIPALVGVSITAQLLAVVVLVIGARRIEARPTNT
jgi:MFS family permease